jgi:hypothetical protein
MSGLAGGVNGSTQHYVGVYLQQFQRLNSPTSFDSKKTQPCQV